MNKPNGAPGAKSVLTMGALGSALLGGLCLGIYGFVTSTQAYQSKSLDLQSLVVEHQASQAKSQEAMAESVVRMEARAEKP